MRSTVLALKSINRFLWLRRLFIRTRNAWLKTVGGVDLGLDINLSLSSRLRPGRKGSIRVGDRTLIAFKTLIYTRDPITGDDLPVQIGKHCFIGGGAMILPGVQIGDEVIVGGGAVVFENVPSQCIVGGNPARILRRDIDVGPFGQLAGAGETAAIQWHS